jgi:hypothetical protein
MQPVHVLVDRTRFEVQVKNPEQPPVPPIQRRGFNDGYLRSDFGSQLQLSERHRRIVPDNARDDSLKVIL